MFPYIILIILIIVMVICMCMYYSYLKIDVTKYDIVDEKIDKNLKILQLSDLHNRNITKELTKIINREKPNLIMISGDMINNFKNDSKNFLDLSKNIKEYETYYTFGNHEHMLSSIEFNRYYKKLLKTKMIILNDGKVDLTKNIRLYGVDFDLKCYHKEDQEKKVKDYLDKTVKKIDDKKYNILIAHNPLWARIYSKKGFDLTLSGHVHGGVIKLPLLGGLLSPEYKFFPEFYEGKQKINKMDLVVSRGLGFCKYIGFRLFNPAEVVIINLKRK